MRIIDIAVPAYNEAPIIQDTLRTLDAVLSRSGIPYGIIVADNGSSDGTADAARGAGLRSVRVLPVEGKGKGLAIIEAARSSDAPLFAFCDADLSADPGAFPELIERVRGGTDIAVGSRLLDERIVDRAFMRTLSSKLFNAFRRRMLGIRVADAQCGMKVFGQRGKEALRDCAETGWFLDLEVLSIADRRGLSVAEVPVRWTEFRYPERKSKLRLVSDGLAAIAAMRRIRRSLRREGTKGIASGGRTGG